MGLAKRPSRDRFFPLRFSTAFPGVKEARPNGLPHNHLRPGQGPGRDREGNARWREATNPLQVTLLRTLEVVSYLPIHQREGNDRLAAGPAPVWKVWPTI